MKIYIVGSAGIPARYGGFEVFAENICKHLGHEYDIHVSCSKKLYNPKERKQKWDSSYRFFLPFKANGIQSIWYDSISLLIACIKADFVIMLGSGGGIFIALLRVFCKTPITVHFDGLEWKREKWGFFSRLYLKINTLLCYKYANYLICDNSALVSYIPDKFHLKIIEIGYGCDHLPIKESKFKPAVGSFALTIARAEPENNLQMILDAFKSFQSMDIIIIANWKETLYGRSLLKNYSNIPNIKLLDPIYDDLYKLQEYRWSCHVYIHGHSAGGTNPSLVEAMAAGQSILAHDNAFNRVTTNNRAHYFNDKNELLFHLNNLDKFQSDSSGTRLKEYAVNNYCWANEAKKLSDLIKNKNVENLNNY